MNDLLQLMWQRQDYTGFAMSVQGSEFKVCDDDLCDLKKIERLLQSGEELPPRVLKGLGKRIFRIIERITEDEI